MKRAMVEFSQKQEDENLIITANYPDGRQPAIWTISGPDGKGRWHGKEANYFWLLRPRPFLPSRDMFRDTCIRMGANFGSLTFAKWKGYTYFGYIISDVELRIYMGVTRITRVELCTTFGLGKEITPLEGVIRWRPKIYKRRNNLDTLPTWIRAFCDVLVRFGAEEYALAQQVDPIWRAF